MSSGKSKSSSSSASTQNTTDNRIAAGEGSIIASSGAQIKIESLDADLAKYVVGENSDLAGNVLDVSSGLATQLLTAFKEKDARQDELVNGFRAVAQDTQTTTRDALAAALNNDAISGKASQYSGFGDWIAKNKIIAGGAAVVVLVVAGMFFFSRRRKSA